MLSPQQWVLEDREGLVPLPKWQKTIDVMARVFDAPAGFIVQYTPHGFQVVIASDQLSNPYPADGGVIPSDTNIFCKQVVEQQQALYVKDATLDPCWETNPEVTEDGFRSYLGLPVCWPSGEPFGTICVMDFKQTDYRHDYVELVAELRDLLEADLEIISQYQVISNIAMTDELTGLYNRRGFFSVAGQYLALAKRSGLSLGLLYLDMDGLKVINDQQGHADGDKALKCLADSIQSVIRTNDIPARLSGDEFVMMVAVENDEQLDAVAERIAMKMAKKSLSVSIGAVRIDDMNQPLDYWLDEADRRMYREKSLGR